MRLSEAIRLGAMLKPQGVLGDMDGDTRCALAGASDAAGVAALPDLVTGRKVVNYAALRRRFPILRYMHDGPTGIVSSVYGEKSPHTLETWIWHLNDQHQWTREQIADWVETIEDQHAADESAAAVSESSQFSDEGSVRSAEETAAHRPAELVED